MQTSSLKNSEVKEISKTERELSIVIHSDAVTREIDAAYQRLSQRVKLKGFRPGKAPRRVLEQYYRPEVERDVIEKVIGQSFGEATQAHNVTPVAEPAIELKTPLKAGEDFSYS